MNHMARFFLRCLLTGAIVATTPGNPLLAEIVQQIGGLDSVGLDSETDQPSAAAVPILVDAKKAVQNRDLEKARQILEGLPPSDRPHSETLLARLCLDAGMRVQARQVLERFATEPTAQYETHLLFAEIAAQESRWYDAVTHVDAAKLHQPPSSWSDHRLKKAQLTLFALQGIAEEGRKNWALANTAYKSALAIDTKYAPALAGLGRSSYQLGDRPAAHACFASLKALQPELESPELSLAKLARQNGDVAYAEKCFRIACRSKMVRDRCTATLAYVDWLLSTNRHDDAKRALMASDVDPSMQTQWQFASALVARMEGDLPAAKRLLSELHQQDSANFAYGNQLALVLIEDRDEANRARALQIAEANCRNHSQQPEAWSTLGWVQYQLGDLASAEKNLANAMQNGVISRDTAWYMSKVKRKLNQPGIADQLREASANAKGPKFTPKD